MKSKVFFTDMRARPTKNMFEKLKMLLKKSRFHERIQKGDIVAVKIHFGEKGNTAYIRPQFARQVVDFIKGAGGKPFLTDTNTLYVGSRTDTPSHIQVAIENGFDFSITNAPIIIADGLRGEMGIEVEVNLPIYRAVKIAPVIHYADSLVVMTHFKGHELFGFGGAIKNLGMGCACREGKLSLHSNVAPYVQKEKCTGCRICLKWCNYSSIIMEGNLAVIIEEKCVGCGFCIPVCPEGAIHNRWDASSEDVQKRTVEYAMGVYKNKKEKTIFLNFLMNITPACDCYGYSDAPIVPDIGILLSYDPVAIDQASVDLVNKSRGLESSRIKESFEPGRDKFKDIWSEVNWEVQLEYAEKIGLGSRSYEIVEV